MTYTVVIPDARHLSTIMDALNTHMVSLAKVKDTVATSLSSEWLTEEIKRCQVMRRQLLNTNADSPEG